MVYHRVATIFDFVHRLALNLTLPKGHGSVFSPPIMLTVLDAVSKTLCFVKHNFGHYPSSFLSFKTLCIEDLILSPSSERTYSDGPNSGS
jgi:hypothetical protein